MAEAMRAQAADDQALQMDERKPEADGMRRSLMTPARRAALDALEREFSELLQARSR